MRATSVFVLRASALLATALIVETGCSQGLGGAISAKSTPPATPNERRVDGGVDLDDVIIPIGGGFIGVYEDVSGAPGLRVAQTTKLPGGLSGRLHLAVPGEAPVWVIVHRDVNRDGRLQFPGADVVIANGGTGAVNTKLLKKAEGSSANKQGGQS
jgi:hypothetical protein